jgi:hypothetical protein
MAIPRNVVAIAAFIALAASGCTQPDPNAKPTYTCTPTDGGTPHPCYKAEYDLQVREDSLYAEAEAVYRKYIAEEERINRIGGITTPSPVILETTTGTFQENVMDNYRELKAGGATAEGGSFKVAWFKRQPTRQLDGSIAALMVCVDASSVQMGARGKTAQPGRINETIGYFVREGGGLKLAASMAKEVEQC